MRVYVAGKYSDNNVLSVLRNIKHGISVATKIMKLGHSPFCPWLDYQFILMEQGETLNVDDFYRYSMDWLKVSDCLVVLDGWESSTGTIAEIETAKKLGIPIYYGLDEFMAAY